MLASLIAYPEIDKCGIFCNPTEPGTPFATPLLIVVDSVRALVILVGVSVILLTVRSALRSTVTGGQTARMAGLALLALYAAHTEGNRIGDWPSLRLLEGVAGVAISVYGMWSFHYRELPAMPRPRTADGGQAGGHAQ